MRNTRTVMKRTATATKRFLRDLVQETRDDIFWSMVSNWSSTDAASSTMISIGFASLERRMEGNLYIQPA